MGSLPEQELGAWVQYLRDLGVYDLYRRDEPRTLLSETVLARLRTPRSTQVDAPGPVAERLSNQGGVTQRVGAVPPAPREASARAPATRPDLPGGPLQRRDAPPPAPLPDRKPLPPVQSPEPPRTYFSDEPGDSQALPPELAAPMPKPQPLDTLFSQPPALPAEQRVSALQQVQSDIGDCTRCPLAYAGRHTIVFGEGDPNATLMFVGEGPGADEDVSGRPFVGKAGQLLTNMIGAMGLQREQVYIANVVKCRPPGNRTPEYIEATTCSQFLLKQIDIVQPRVIVALGTTAATYVLGVRQSLASLRGQWFGCRGAKVAVTYHPAFLLRDPRQKVEAWKDLQRVMAELGLKAAKNG